jgi:short-subunit dehydrogenase
MSHYFAPKFLERFEKEGKRSAIINISSINSVYPEGKLPIYNSTKAFNRLFS